MIKNRKEVCSNCIGESYLKERVKKKRNIKDCSYCKQKGSVIFIDDLAKIISIGFDHFYKRTPLKPTQFEEHLLSRKKSNLEWKRHGVNVINTIMEAAKVKEEVAKEIRKSLEESVYDQNNEGFGKEREFAAESYYQHTIPEDYSWQKEWEEFENKLNYEARHFNKFGINLLDKIFDGIERMETNDGNKLVTAIGPETDIPFLYRARVFHSEAKLKEAFIHPDEQFGPPPYSYAIPGRMNARGISMFYSAIEEETAIGEVRPPVGSKVVVSKFNVLRELKLLNLDALTKINSVGSIFDSDYIRQVKRGIFLKRLSVRMSRPVMPDDEQVDYLITQAIADYLAVESKFSFDGIMYPSVQSDNKGVNVVLFHKSSRVEFYPKELYINLDADAEEGLECDYNVMETKQKKLPNIRRVYHNLREKGIDIDQDERKYSLSIDTKTIRIHHIKGVTFRKDSHDLKFIDGSSKINAVE